MSASVSSHLRPDLAVIAAHIEPGTRVLDVGCGDGALMAALLGNGCDVRGIEIDCALVETFVARGLSVVQGDADRDLVDYPYHGFDYAVLSQTLQQVRLPRDVLTEMLRIAKKAVVVVPNFGHWRVRLQIVRYGRAPVTDALPYEGYNSPNLHFMSMHDFHELVLGLGFRIIRELPIVKGRAKERAWAANLRADSAMYVLERPAEN